MVLRRFYSCDGYSNGCGGKERGLQCAWSLLSCLDPRGRVSLVHWTSQYWVRRGLAAEGLIENKRRAKHLFSKEDLTVILLTLWTKDDLRFIHERNRVQFTFIFHVYCWIGARLGAFFTRSLRCRVRCRLILSPLWLSNLRQDIELVMQRSADRGWRLIYKVDQR